MFDGLVGQSDLTTTGGQVIGASSTMFDNGKRLALNGDGATCGKCAGGPFPIFATAYTMMENGKALAKDKDWVGCPCGQNRVIANSTMFYSEGASQRTASPALSNVHAQTITQAVNDAQHTRWFFVRDSVTGKPRVNRDFMADVGGVRQAGKTDGEGYAKIATDGEQSVSIHIIFSSPKRNLKPNKGA